MRHLLLMMLLVPMLLSASGPSTGVDFFDGSYQGAKTKAAVEGKLFFMDFTAKWCTPCKWMEETTFTDPALVAYVKENTVALKIDIDEFDGFELKEQFGISILPSVLIFNSKGDFLEQYEESLSAKKMLEILKKHDIPSNRIAVDINFGASDQTVQVQEEVVQPTQVYQSTQPVYEVVRPALRKQNSTPITDTPVTESTVATANNENANLPATFMMHGNVPLVDASPGSIKREALRPTKNKLFSIPSRDEDRKPTLHSNMSYTETTTNYEVVEEVVEKPVVTNEAFEKPTTQLIDVNLFDQEGLFRFDVRRQLSEGYSVQVGAYTEYGNVIRQAALMQQSFNEPVIVHISKNNRRTLYKLMIGEFINRDEAINFMRVAKAKGLEGMIKDLSIH